MIIRSSDTAFSKYIRTRDDWTCRRCKAYHEPPTMALHCSHYFGRTRESVRFDPDNCIALCYGCHHFWEKEDREAYREYMIEWLGEDRHEALVIRSRMKGNRDDKMEAMIWREALKQIQKDKNKSTYGSKL